MKSVLVLFLLLFAATAEAGRAHSARVYVRSVSCVILESLPLQYSGTASVYSYNLQRRVLMRFITSTNIDVRNVCLQLKAREGRDVIALYNLRENLPPEPITRIIHGFSRGTQAFVVNGSIFEDISEFGEGP
jgi:hypothetical protein